MARMLMGVGLVVALLVAVAVAVADHRSVGKAQAQNDGQSVALTARDVAWDKTDLTVAPGDTIVLTNAGVLEHNFAVEGVNDRAPVDIPPRGKARITWTVPPDLAPGTYEYYCAVPGHRQSGMHGILTVTAGSGVSSAPLAPSGQSPATPSALGGGEARLQATIDAQATEIADLQATVAALRQDDDHGGEDHGEDDDTASASPSPH